MGLFSKLVLRWASSAAERDLDEAIARVRGLDAGEVAFLVVLATDFRNLAVPDLKLPLLDFHELTQPRHAATPLKLSMMAKHAQKAGNLPFAASIMVWIHTARAAQDQRLRYKAKLLWSELSRGFPYLRNAELEFLDMFGRSPSIFNAGRFPDGLDPTA
ncbi:hypothetical protein V1281_001898 [Nitrobacteraceae bacterium AZCC 2161]